MARVLLTTFTFWPNIDGVACASLSAAKALTKVGHDVTVVTGDVHAQSPAGEGFRVVRFDVHGIRGGEVPIGGKDVEAYVQFIIGEPWEVVICEGWAVWSTALAEDVFPLHPAKKILVSHGAPGPMWVPKRKPFWGLGPVYRSCLLLRGLQRHFGLYHRLVFLGRRGQWSAYADAMMAFRNVPDKCVVIPNEINVGEFGEQQGGFRRRNNIGSGFLAVSVANFSATKNQCRTLDVFLRARLDGATLCLIGSTTEGEYAQHLATLAAGSRCCQGSWKTLVLSGLPRDEVCAAIRDADVSLLTSRKETQSIFLLEGMAAGVPFVSTPTGCASSWPGGITTGSTAGLVAALRSVAGDPQFRRALGASGRQYVLRVHSGSVIRAQWVNLIEEVVGNRARASVSRTG